MPNMPPASLEFALNAAVAIEDGPANYVQATVVAIGRNSQNEIVHYSCKLPDSTVKVLHWSEVKSWPVA